MDEGNRVFYVGLGFLLCLALLMVVVFSFSFGRSSVASECKKLGTFVESRQVYFCSTEAK